MAKLLADKPGAFGRRLAQARRDADYTQQELADEIGATRRMIAYYETESDYPPTNMLAGIAQALNITSDELLGIKQLKKSKKPDTRLQRRVQQIEKLPTKDKRQLVQVIDTFLKAAQI
jgi:transcriptional regulator with XRE-family HTH domain